MSKPLRVGVIGAGGIAQMMHLPHLFERGDLFQISSVADVSGRTLEAVARHYRIPHATADFRELCRREDVEAVLLLASGSHRDAAMCALESGKHLFVEKPLGYGRRETEEISRAAKKSGRVLMVGYHKRFDPAYLRAREAARAMRDLRYVEVTVLHPDDGAYRGHHVVWPEPGRPRPAEPEEVGDRRGTEKATAGPLAQSLEEIAGKAAPDANRVGALILVESLIHDLNAVRGVLGEPEEVLSAHVWRGGFAQSSLSRFGGEVRVNASWISLPGLRHYEERLRFIGSSGRVTLTFPSAYLRHFPTALEVERMDGPELVVEQRTVSYEEPFRAELHHFRDCVLSGRRPELGEDEALADLRWIEAIARKYA